MAPLTLPEGSVEDLSGSIGSVDNAHAYEEMNPFAAAIYYFGDINCHQIDERTYSLNGNELPICARDLGIFIGLTVGLLLSLLIIYSPKFLHVVLLAAPMGLDGGIQALTDYESFNGLRLLTGLLGGLAIAMFLILIANEMYKDEPRTRWCQLGSPACAGCTEYIYIEGSIHGEFRPFKIFVAHTERLFQ